MLVVTIPFPLQSFIGDSHCSIGDLSLLAKQGRTEGDVMNSILILMVITSIMVVSSHHCHHTP